MIIRVLPLIEPWASAIAWGYKAVETRGRSTKIRGLIGIYSTKTFPPYAEVIANQMRDRGLFAMAPKFPHGKLVAFAEIAEVKPVEQVRPFLTGLEEKLGNYEAGRFAWQLVNIRRLAVPFPMRGHQGWVSAEVPNEIVASAIPVVAHAHAL